MSDILVIGGGAIGLLTARELAKAGTKVTLVEMGETGREASWAGGGVLSPLYPWRYADSVTALSLWSQREYPGLCAELLEETGVDPEIEPVRGQMILFYAKPGQVNHVVLYRNRYVIPRRDGRVLIGSTLERAGFVKATTAEAKEDLYRAAVEMFPLLKRTPIENHWAGLRPGSPSGIPYIGAFPDVEGLYFNAGHYRNGLVTGPASARLAADLLLRREPVADPAPYALDAPR